MKIKPTDADNRLNSLTALRAMGQVALGAWRPLLLAVGICWLVLALGVLTLVAAGQLSWSGLIDPQGPGSGADVTAGEVLALLAWLTPLLVLPFVVHGAAAVLSGQVHLTRSKQFAVAALRDVPLTLGLSLAIAVFVVVGAILLLLPGVLALLVSIWAVPILLLDRPNRFDRLVDRCFFAFRRGGLRQAGSLFVASLLISLVASMLFSLLSPYLGLVGSNLLIGPLAGLSWWLWVTISYMRLPRPELAD